MLDWWKSLTRQGRAIVVLGGFFVLLIAASARDRDAASTTTTATSYPTAPNDAAYSDAARRQGYSGREADQVGAAAERICAGTGKC